MSSNRLPLLALLGAVAAGPVTARAESPPPATAPASRPATAPATARAAAGRLPGEDENGRLKWDEVCQVRLVGGKLVLSTGLTSELLVKAGITRPTTKDVQMEGLSGARRSPSGRKCSSWQHGRARRADGPLHHRSPYRVS